MKPEIEITEIVRAALESEVTLCVVLPDGRHDAFETIYVQHDLGDSKEVRNADIQKAVDEWQEKLSQQSPDYGTLMDYATGDDIRPATKAEAEASRNGGPEGVILVEINGTETACFVAQ